MHIKPLADILISDASSYYRMMSEKRHVDFSVLNGEMYAYMWQAEGEGRIFLSELERYAENHNYQLMIPTVLSKRLIHILESNGYTMKEIPHNGTICELWSKWDWMKRRY